MNAVLRRNPKQAAVTGVAAAEAPHGTATATPAGSVNTGVAQAIAALGAATAAAAAPAATPAPAGDTGGGGSGESNPSVVSGVSGVSGGEESQSEEKTPDAETGEGADEGAADGGGVDE